MPAVAATPGSRSTSEIPEEVDVASCLSLSVSPTRELSGRAGYAAIGMFLSLDLQ